MGLAFLYFQHMPIPDQVVEALVEGAVLAMVARAREVALVTVASAALEGAVLVMVAQAVDLVVREEVFLMVDLAAHVAVPEAPVVGEAARGVGVVGGRVHGAVVGMAAAHGAGVIRIMAGAGVRRLCSVLCLVSQ